jgi:hypothetical protein
VVLAVVLPMIVLPTLSALAGPQDDPPPPVATVAGDGRLVPNLAYSLTLTLAEALADQTLSSGQVAQVEATAAAAKAAAAAAAGGSAASTTAADTPPSPAPGSVDEAKAIASSECAWRAASVPAGDARWGVNDPAAGALLVNTCNGPERYLYVPDPPPGAPAAPPPPRPDRRCWRSRRTRS